MDTYFRHSLRRGIWALQVGVLLGIASVGLVSINVKRWIKNRKDRLAVNPPTSQNNFNTIRMNRAIASVMQTIGYLTFCLFLTTATFVVKPLFYQNLTKEDIVRLQETLLLFTNDIIIPILYCCQNDDLKNFVLTSNIIQ